MSLDVYLCEPEVDLAELKAAADLCMEHGMDVASMILKAKAESQERGWDMEEYFHANITHNLNNMAGEAGVYEALWSPEEMGWSRASDILPALEKGLNLLRSDPDRFRSFSPKNGWGTYDGLVKFVESYLEACRKYPDSVIRVSR